MYSTLHCLTLRGWPKHLKQVLRIAQHFWGTQDELSIKASILLKDDQVCIPSELLNCTLADLHGTHQGMEKIQAQAREAVYQPGIDADIIDYVRRCTICTKHKVSPAGSTHAAQDIPNGPWQEVASSYFHHKGKE